MNITWLDVLKLIAIVGGSSFAMILAALVACLLDGWVTRKKS